MRPAMSAFFNVYLAFFFDSCDYELGYDLLVLYRSSHALRYPSGLVQIERKRQKKKNIGY